jgi:hypothetical protein
MQHDSTETIDACTGDSRWWNASSVVYADCIDIVSSIGSVSFNFCPRKANQVAHEIAKFSFLNNQIVIRSMNPLALFLIGS